ncbi:MAG: HD-GYP domain-containing protein [Treponema sp.]
MHALKLLEIENSVCFTEDVYLDKKFLLFISGMTFSQELKYLIQDWQFTTLYTEGTYSQKLPEQEQPKEIAEQDSKPKVSTQPIQNADKQQSGASIAKVYSQFLTFTKRVYDRYKKTKTLDVHAITAKTKELALFVKNNKQLILILQSILPYNVDDFLTIHALRSTVFALVIGIQLEMTDQQLNDLAIASLLHEIGLTHIPEEIYAGEAKLSDEQRKYLHVHPVLSCKILKKSKFTLPICLGALDHHECENGKGYPQRLTGEKISRYGKIIAVACSYEAAISPRRYKEALEPAEGLMNIFMHKRALYDEDILRALLCALSFFPIGSFVVLANKAIAQVIDTNPEDPRSPLVRVISGGSSAVSEAIQTSMSGMSITRAATKEEWEAALAGKK